VKLAEFKAKDKQTSPHQEFDELVNSIQERLMRIDSLGGELTAWRTAGAAHFFIGDEVEEESLGTPSSSSLGGGGGSNKEETEHERGKGQEQGFGKKNRDAPDRGSPVRSSPKEDLESGTGTHRTGDPLFGAHLKEEGQVQEQEDGDQEGRQEEGQAQEQEDGDYLDFLMDLSTKQRWTMLDELQRDEKLRKRMMYYQEVSDEVPDMEEEEWQEEDLLDELQREELRGRIMYYQEQRYSIQWPEEDGDNPDFLEDLSREQLKAMSEEMQRDERLLKKIVYYQELLDFGYSDLDDGGLSTEEELEEDFYTNCRLSSASEEED
jgi:hypothetical protein